MKMAYNPYSAINAIYNYKNEWDAANKSGDTTAKNKAAENAQVFYKQLRDNGQKKLADELSALDASGAKYILDQYSAKNSGVDNQAYNTSMQSATDKNNKLAGYIDSDRNDVQGKYNDIYNYANQDITKTDEYKSTYDRMMNKYDLSALQGRDNAVASGGASNGGNIDSYAAANAMRQQASIIANGQQVAHQAGLDAYNSRISNVSNILNNLGVYNSGTYDAMNQTIANDANLAHQYFDNSETSKNNEAARQEVYSNISGTVGDKVTKYLNGNVWNDDGSLVNANQDFQASINSLEKTLYATTDENERARIKEQLRVLEAARNQKIDEQGLTYGKTYKYQSDKQSEAGRQFDVQADISKQALTSEEKIAAANNQNTLDQIEANKNANLELAQAGVKLDKNGNPQIDDSDEPDIDTALQGVYDESDDTVQSFIGNVLKPEITAIQSAGGNVDERWLVLFLLKNSQEYDLQVKDLKAICDAFGTDTTWVNNFKDKGLFGWGKGVKGSLPQELYGQAMTLE